MTRFAASKPFLNVPIFFFPEKTSAYLICCMYLVHFSLDLMEANDLSPDQTAPMEAVVEYLYLLPKNISRKESR